MPRGVSIDSTNQTTNMFEAKKVGCSSVGIAASVHEARVCVVLLDS